MDKFKVAHSLACDLAERYMASNIADMMITGSKDKARAIRELSESNNDQCNRQVQEFRGYQRVIYSSLYNLIDGYNGYELVKTMAIKSKGEE